VFINRSRPTVWLTVHKQMWTNRSVQQLYMYSPILASYGDYMTNFQLVLNEWFT